MTEPQPRTRAITSTQNARIKAIVRLQRQSAARRRSGLFCVESLRELQRALDGGFQPVELHAVPDWLNEHRSLVAGMHAGRTAVFEVAGPVLEKAAYRRNPEGFVAVLRARMRRLDDLKHTADGPYIVCGGLEKPGNIGAIARSADAAGGAAVLIDRPDADVFNPNCIRSAAGAVFGVPIACERAEAILAWLRDHRIRLIAATGDAPMDYTRADLTGPCAIVLGGEAGGLDATWREAADAAVRIPMRGTVDSLNVSVAAAVLLFEAARQRDLAGRAESR